jgi:hypothetical protein
MLVSPARASGILRGLETLHAHCNHDCRSGGWLRRHNHRSRGRDTHMHNHMHGLWKHEDVHSHLLLS